MRKLGLEGIIEVSIGGGVLFVRRYGFESFRWFRLQNSAMPFCKWMKLVRGYMVSVSKLVEVLDKIEKLCRIR